MSYKNKLRSDTWKRFSEDVKRMDGYKCVDCGSETNLHVHHKIYYGYRNPWEYTIDLLETLCCTCHNRKHIEKDLCHFVVKDRKEFMKIKRIERAKYREIYKKDNIFKRGMTAQEIYNIMNNIK